MGLAAVLAYWLSVEDSEPKSAATPAPTASSPAPEPMPQVAPTRPVPIAPAPTQPSPIAPSAPATTPPAAKTVQPTVDERFADAQVREHAQTMLIETTRHTLKMRDLAQLQHLRETLRKESAEHLLAPSDLQAMDLGIECLSQAQDFRQRALDFLEDNPSSPFAEELRGACR